MNNNDKTKDTLLVVQKGHLVFSRKSSEGEICLHMNSHGVLLEDKKATFLLYKELRGRIIEYKNMSKFIQTLKNKYPNEYEWKDAQYMAHCFMWDGISFKGKGKNVKEAIENIFVEQAAYQPVYNKYVVPLPDEEVVEEAPEVFGVKSMYPLFDQIYDFIQKEEKN